MERGFASGTPGPIEYQITAHEVVDRLLRHRTLRVLELQVSHQPGVPLRSTPVLSYRRAPRAKANQTDGDVNQDSFSL